MCYSNVLRRLISSPVFTIAACSMYCLLLEVAPSQVLMILMIFFDWDLCIMSCWSELFIRLVMMRNILNIGELLLCGFFKIWRISVAACSPLDLNFIFSWSLRLL